MSVIYSSSINNAFISTVDHLPTDVVRSLWLLQSINLRIDKAQSQLDELLTKQQQQLLSQDDLRLQYQDLTRTINYLRAESIQESKALYNQLIAHKLSLSEEVDQLVSIQTKLKNSNANYLANKELREKLKEHYRENPLLSQREALKEQEMINKGASTTKVAGTTKAGDGRTANGHLGLKLLLKLPKNRTTSKAIKNNLKASKSVRKTAADTSSRSNKIIKSNVTKTSSRAQPKSNTKKPINKKVAAAQEPIITPLPIQVDDNQKYCFCKQGSFGDMIGCDNETSCPNGEWFHYKCVGLLNRVEALKYTTGKNKWFCSDHCRDVVMNKLKKKRRRKKGNKW